MCGIIGIITLDKQVSFDLYNSLLDLQHRGQDNAGIYTNDSEKTYIKKGSGLVAEIFNPENLSELKGTIGIGQVRYPTTVGKIDAQPFYEDISGIALAHNGNVFNENNLRKLLKNKRIYCDSDCDAETILKVFVYYFNKTKGEIKKRCFSAAKKTMKKVDGSYSVVSVIRDVGLFVFRDPHAIRPFVYGKKTKNSKTISYAFASESVAIENIVDSIERVKAGEAIFVDHKLHFTKKLLLPKKAQHCMFEWVYFSRSTSVAEGIGVNHARGNLGKELAKIFRKSDLYKKLQTSKRKIIVAPVPETARPAAVVFARHTKYTYKDILEKNRFIGRIFIKPNETLRQHEVAANVKVIKEVVKNKIVLLIDDSIVRGTTSRGIVQKIKNAGAKEVHLFSTCPPLIYPCFYGVDFPDAKTLVAYKKSLKEIADYIGVDSINYLDINHLVKAIGITKNHLCLACLNGVSPTPQKLVENL